MLLCMSFEEGQLRRSHCQARWSPTGAPFSATAVAQSHLKRRHGRPFHGRKHRSGEAVLQRWKHFGNHSAKLWGWHSLTMCQRTGFLTPRWHIGKLIEKTDVTLYKTLDPWMPCLTVCFFCSTRHSTFCLHLHQSSHLRCCLAENITTGHWLSLFLTLRCREEAWSSRCYGLRTILEHDGWKSWITSDSPVHWRFIQPQFQLFQSEISHKFLACSILELNKASLIPASQDLPPPPPLQKVFLGDSHGRKSTKWVVAQVQLGIASVGLL